MRGDQNAGPLFEVLDEGDRDGDLGLPDVVSPALCGTVQVNHDRERSAGSDVLRGVDLVENSAVGASNPAARKVLSVLAEEGVGRKRRRGTEREEEGKKGAEKGHDQGERGKPPCYTKY